MFGENLKRIRLARGWTQAELGKKVGATHSHVGRWERGEVEPRPKTKNDLAVALGVAISELYKKEAPASGSDAAGAEHTVRGVPVSSEMAQYFGQMSDRDFADLLHIIFELRESQPDILWGLERLTSLVRLLRRSGAEDPVLRQFR